MWHLCLGSNKAACDAPTLLMNAANLQNNAAAFKQKALTHLSFPPVVFCVTCKCLLTVAL